MKFAFFKKPWRARLGIVFLIFGISLAGYFTAVSVNWGRADTFNTVMVIAGLAWIIIAVKHGTIAAVYGRLPRMPKIFLKAVLFSFLLSFAVVEGVIIYNMRTTAAAGADYIIALGCQVDGSIPSIPLLRRMHTAAKYLEKNQNTNAVVSGGQGPGENISEAAVMKRILMQSGINENRILEENNSRSTMENFKFSDKLYNIRDKNVIIVSTDYHMFRALSTAKKLNYKNIKSLPSRSQLSVLPAYLLREYAAVVYYAISKKI